jgi:hypothetical protein
MATCMCGCGRTIGRLRPQRRAAHDYWRTASMLTGLLCYAERVQPGWFASKIPAGFRRGGEGWRELFLSVAHGEQSLRAEDHVAWTTWRNMALGWTSSFRGRFDPNNVLITFGAASGVDFEDFARRLGSPDGPDPIGEVATRMSARA